MNITSLLIDYGNIPILDKNRGLAYVVDTLINRLGPEKVLRNQQISARLYDGWYDGNTLSKHAQRLASEVSELSPVPITVRAPEDTFQVKVQIELARSLICDPGKDILHTYRRRAFPSGLECALPPFEGCMDAGTCIWNQLPGFLSNRRCPRPGCGMHPKRIISRAEQKVVDTMITSDMVQLALSGENFAIASSDDDMWPGIRLSLNLGRSIVHLHTKKGQSTALYYAEGLLNRYIQIEA